MKNKINLLFDFDGVILDSMGVRDEGFRNIFKNYPKKCVEELISYHRLNGGLSRYVKIRYFFESLLGESISESEVNRIAAGFSSIMKERLVEKQNLIQDTLGFIKENHTKYPLHIVSGSDGEELRFLCRELGIKDYFLSIQGSPTPKNQLVKDLLMKYAYPPENTYLIGDSINDFEAAQVNKIHFVGYNNPGLIGLSPIYLRYLKDFFGHIQG